ncbi:hypothetical protein Taro_035460, partial [Colocasia esculenta]|nr:hypothetical protein [Colocasia esculenta]
RSVSPSGSPDPWAAVPTVGSLVGAGDPGAGAVTLSAHIDEEMSALKQEFKVLNRPGTNIFCKGSVDTTNLGVDTMVQNKGRNVKKSPSQVDTSPEQVDTTSSQVDTRDLFQGTVLLV